MSQQSPMNRWLVVFGAIVIQLCLGSIYAWSVYTPALMEAGWNKLETQIVFSVGLISFAVTMVLAGRNLKIWGPRRLAIAGGILLCVGYLLNSSASQRGTQAIQRAWFPSPVAYL